MVSRRGSMSELKTVIKQYERKVKILQNHRDSKSPPIGKQKKICKSHSLVDEESKSYLNSIKDINRTNIEYGLRTPEQYSNGKNLKSLKSENFLLKKTLKTLKKEHEKQIDHLKRQLECEKQAEIDTLTKFYVGKISECEEAFEQNLKKRLDLECLKIHQELAKDYENKLREFTEEKQKECDILHNHSKNKQKLNKNQLLNTKFLTYRDPEDSFDAEQKFRQALEEKTCEFDRRLHQQHQESLSLRKENTIFKQKILELQSKLEAISIAGTDKESESSYILSLNRRYNDLLSVYTALKSSHSDQKPSSPSYCLKCKAFIHTNDELSKKILRLKEFLST